MNYKSRDLKEVIEDFASLSRDIQRKILGKCYKYLANKNWCKEHDRGSYGKLWLSDLIWTVGYVLEENEI